MEWIQLSQLHGSEPSDSIQDEEYLVYDPLLASKA